MQAWQLDRVAMGMGLGGWLTFVRLFVDCVAIRVSILHFIDKSLSALSSRIICKYIQPYLFLVLI